MKSKGKKNKIIIKPATAHGFHAREANQLAVNNDREKMIENAGWLNRVIHSLFITRPGRLSDGGSVGDGFRTRHSILYSVHYRTTISVSYIGIRPIAESSTLSKSRWMLENLKRIPVDRPLKAVQSPITRPGENVERCRKTHLNK